MPNCTIIKTGATVTSTHSERVSELKALIDAIALPVVGPYVGDAVLYDSVTGSIIIVEAAELTAESYPADRYTPIGVVAIPKLHNVYGDGTCGVVSLKYMNYSTPDDGSTSSQYMYWGYNAKQVTSKLFTIIPTIGDFDNQSDTVTGADYMGALPSDAFDTSLVSLCDPQAQYSTSVSGVEASPSPYYMGNARRNPLYTQTSEPSSESNAFTDFGGAGNTQMMLDNVGVSDWQTSSIISNSYSSGNYPSACCCWRYHTPGTNQGDWYLPACGEVGYLVARMQTINDTISNIVSIYGSDTAALLADNVWASTEYSASQVWSYNLSNGYVYTNTKSSNYDNVRAFLRV